MKDKMLLTNLEVGKDAFGDVIGGVGSEKAANNFLRKRFASQIVGMFGGNVTASQLLARGNGEIINPNIWNYCLEVRLYVILDSNLK